MSTTLTAVRFSLTDYVELTKPRIVTLVVFTTFSGMWLASGHIPPLSLLITTLLGVGMVSAAGCVLNNVIDRDIDRLMQRTKHRALAQGRILPSTAIYFSTLLVITGLGLLASATNLLTVGLTLAALISYVGLYTLLLKRRSSLSTEIGGIAGALPPVIGWAAINNSISELPISLFIIMMVWQPPHFWVLALIKKEEYQRAGIPLLPIVKGDSVTRNWILAYTIALIPISLLPYFYGGASSTYLIIACVIGLLYLSLTIRFYVQSPINTRSAWKLFAFSIFYISIIFAGLLAA